MAPKILLTGAGFSRNWGGWTAAEAFEFLLGCPQIRDDPASRQLLWKHSDTGGFENALADVQAAYRSDPVGKKAQLEAFQWAVMQMFDAMNEGFKFMPAMPKDPNHPWSHPSWMIFQFDAIFTLNQDLLMEMMFFSEAPTPRWENLHLPGIERVSPEQPGLKTWATGTWTPRDGPLQPLSPKLLPYYKLHGSANWRTRGDEPLLIMGGRKAEAIRLFPILGEYAKAFEERLNQPGARLMVIGYGFRDPHINEAIIKAIRGGLRLFVIDPQGSGLARSVNDTRSPKAAISAPTDLEDAFEMGLMGASRRSFLSLFGTDRIERRKVDRFFEEA